MRNKHYKKYCGFCGKYYEGRGRKYCSIICRYKKEGMPSRKGVIESKAIREKKSIGHRGIKAYNYKGGETLNSLKNRIRNCFKYRQWRSDVYAGDNFTCVMCGYDRGGILEADHYPIGFSEILNHYKIRDLDSAIFCEKLWDINNGRTLCKNCHKKTKNYGRPKQ